MKTRGLVILSLFAMAVFGSFAVIALPSGGTVTELNTTTAPADTPTTDDAFAGNITHLTVTAFTTTQAWQGYFGNVSGTIQLADSSDNVLYNWSLASPEGEIYASTNASIVWQNVSCFNFSASETYADDSAQAGATSFFGTGITTLETRYGIAWDDVDGVNETFSLSGAGTHDLFYVTSLEFSEGECQNTRIFDSTGAGVNDNFEEVLLYESTTHAIIFAAILDEDDPAGFDGHQHDFEMLVLEDGHGTDTATTTYYFYVELE